MKTPHPLPLILALLLLLTAAGCTVTADPVVGTWQCGNTDTLAFIFSIHPDGTGTYTVFMNGNELTLQQFTWKKIDTNQYTITMTDNGHVQILTLRGATLFDGGREYRKAETVPFSSSAGSSDGVISTTHPDTVPTELIREWTISTGETYGTKEYNQVTYPVFYHQTLHFKDLNRKYTIIAEDMGSPTYIELKYSPELVEEIVVSDGKEYRQDPSPKYAWFTLTGIPDPVIYGTTKNKMGSAGHRSYEVVTLRTPDTYNLLFEGEKVDVEVTIFGAA